jgi:putative transposase
MDGQALTKPYSLDLRDRAVARVVAGETVRSVAATLRGRFERREWPPRFRATGSAAPRKMGGHRPRVLIGEHRAWLLQRIASGPDMTLRGLAAELAEQGVKVSYRTVWNFVHREKISYKKTRFPGRAKSPRRRPPSRARETLSGQD